MRFWILALMKQKKFDCPMCGHRLNNYTAKDINYIYVCVPRTHHVGIRFIIFIKEISKQNMHITWSLKHNHSNLQEIKTTWLHYPMSKITHCRCDNQHFFFLCNSFNYFHQLNVKTEHGYYIICKALQFE